MATTSRLRIAWRNKCALDVLLTRSLHSVSRLARNRLPCDVVRPTRVRLGTQRSNKLASFRRVALPGNLSWWRVSRSAAATCFSRSPPPRTRPTRNELSSQRRRRRRLLLRRPLSAPVQRSSETLRSCKAPCASRAVPSGLVWVHRAKEPENGRLNEPALACRPPTTVYHPAHYSAERPLLGALRASRSAATRAVPPTALSNACTCCAFWKLFCHLLPLAAELLLLLMADG